MGAIGTELVSQAVPTLTQPELWQALLLGWVAVVVAVGYALISGYYRLRGLARDLNGVGAKVDRHDTFLAVAGNAGGGRGGIPAWNQLADPNSDGSLPAQRTLECGEECAAMVCMWRHSVPVSADYVRYLLRGASGTALTTPDDVALCCTLLNVRTQPRSNLQWEEARQIIRTATAAGRPVGVLTRPGRSTLLHWILAYSSDDKEVHCNDPWGGVRRIYSWIDLQNVFGAGVVEVLDHQDT